MSCSVNLIPDTLARARLRGQRRKIWIGICSAAAVLLFIGWSVERAAAVSLRKTSESLSALEAQHAEVNQALAAVDAECAALLEQLQTVATARRPQPWPGRLVAMSGTAPGGVFLTRIRVSAPDESRASPRGVSFISADATSDEDDARPVASQAVQLFGYAADHEVLIQWLNAVQELPGWQEVELVRATLEPYGHGLAVAFELDCETVEGS